MKIEKFEDVIAWQKAKELAVCVYKLFKNSRDFGFRDQIQRAAISVSNNIAEGFERRTDDELKYFLYIAKGSCGEIRSMAHIAHELKYLEKTDFDRVYNYALEISKILGGFIKKL